MTTRNLVPRADGEGSLGTAEKQWGAMRAKKVYIDGTDFEEVLEDTLDAADAADDAKTQAAASATEAAGSVVQAEAIKDAMLTAYGYPFTALTAAGMTDTTKIYVYTGSETGYTFGHWYYHNGTAWTDGGVYNAIAFNTDPTLTISGAAADAKVVGNELNDIKGTLYKDETNLGIFPYTEHAGYPSSLDGYTNTSLEHSYVTEYVPCSEGDVFWYKGYGPWAVTYTNNGSLVDHLTLNSKFTHSKIVVPSGVNGVRFASNDWNANEIVFDVFEENSVKGEIEKTSIVTDALSDDFGVYDHEGYISAWSSSNQRWSFSDTSNQRCKITKPIKCKPGDVFYYKGDAAVYSVTFFGASSNHLSHSKYTSLTTFKKITVPSDSEYVVFSANAPNNKELIFEVYKEGNPHFENKNLSESLAQYVRRAETDAPLHTQIVDGYLTDNGTFAGTTQHRSRITDRIRCYEGDVFYYYGICSDAVVACMWWDEDGNIIGVEKPSDAGGYYQQTFVAPENAHSVMFTSYNNKAAAVEPGLVVTQKISTYNSPLTWKKWYPCGDSFTAGDFTGLSNTVFTTGKYVGRTKSYPYHIGNRTGIDVHRGSTSGETMAQYTNGTVVFSNSNYEFGYKSIPSDADYITLWFGINDSGHNIPIGTIDDDENTTFYGAWNVVLDDLTTRCLKAHIGIIVSNNLSKPYVDATIAVAEKWGIPYLDLNYDESVPLMHYSLRPNASAEIKAKRNEQFAIEAGTNNHPNLFAHEYESYFIEKWLLSL